MNIVYLVGNGFDIAAGLDTSAPSIIFQIYQQLNHDITIGRIDSPTLMFLANNLEYHYDTWANFEMALGALTKEVERLNDPCGAFREIFDYFRTMLCHHIENENNRIKTIDFNDFNINTFYMQLRGCMTDRILGNIPWELKSVHSNQQNTISFINYNYTELLDNLLAYTNMELLSIKNRLNLQTDLDNLQAPIHIHGMINGLIPPIVGVDNENQIVGLICKNDTYINSSLIKPKTIQNLQQQNIDKASDLINNANVICIFGMSIGESDRSWWIKIGEWLKKSSSNVLVISKYRKEDERYLAERMAIARENLKKSFLDVADIEDDITRDNLLKRIYVSFDEQLTNRVL